MNEKCKKSELINEALKKVNGRVNRVNHLSKCEWRVRKIHFSQVFRLLVDKKFICLELSLNLIICSLFQPFEDIINLDIKAIYTP